MASNFAPQLGIKGDNIETRLFPVTAGQTFIAGALVYVTSGAVSECGADPALILGVAKAPASIGLATGGSIYGGTNIPVDILDNTTVAFMGSATTPVFATHVAVTYGIVKSTNWLVDISDTTNDTVMIIDVSLTPLQEGFYVKFAQAKLQFSGITV